MAGIFLASQPTRSSEICSDLPLHVLGCGALQPRGLDFLYQRFSSLLRDEACQFRNQQSRTVVKFGNHSSIWDSWPIAFSGYPRGCDLKAVEVTVRRNRSRPDLISHDEYSRSSGRKATTCLKRSDNVSRDRKIDIGTARRRCICQHQGGEGPELIAR